MEKETFDTELADFAHAVGLLVRRVRAVAASEELSWSEMRVLNQLAKEGPATTADLARSQGMKPQSMRTILVALEEEGMIERKPHATDGRQVNIELTDRGIAAQQSSGDAKRTWLAQAMAQLDAQERETLFAAGRIIKRVVERDPL